MGVDWDPVAGIRGLAWPVTRKGGVLLDTRAAALYLPSTSTETVTALSVYLDQIVGSPTFELDVFDLVDPFTVKPAIAVYQPNEDVTFTHTGTGTMSGTPTNTAGNRYTNVDETPTADSSDYIQLADDGSSSVATYEFRVNVGAGPAGNLFVSAVRVKAKFRNASSISMCYIHATLNGTNVGGTTVLAASGTQTFTVVEMLTNPATGVAWTKADIVALDTTSKFGLVWGLAGSVFSTYLDWISVEVDYQTDYRIVAPQFSPTVNGWQTITLSPTWAKTNAHNYALLLKRITGGQAVLRSLDSLALMPGGHASYRPTLVNGALTALNTQLTPAHPLVMTVSGAASADSQPYVDLVRSPVDTTHTVQQEFTADATNSRQWVKVVTGSTRHQLPAASLTVKIKKRSDNSQVGGTGTITTAQVASSPYPLQAVECVLASAASLTNGTQYYVELTCTAAAGTGWDVALLDAKTPPVSGYTAGFGGDTDRVTISAVEYDDLDAVVVVGTVPTAPAGFTAT
jgi:hypothetical protein